MNNEKILIVDDDKDVLKATTDYIKEEGYHIDSFETIDDALDALHTNQYAVAIIDMDFPKEPEGGIRITNYIKENNINTLPIIFTGKGSLDNLKKVFKDIYDYVEKGEGAINELMNKLDFCFKSAISIQHSTPKLKKSEFDSDQHKSVYNEKILFVVDDDYMQKYITDEGYNIDSFEIIDKALAALQKNQYAVAVIDMNFSKDPEGGTIIVNYIKEKKINTLLIIIIEKGCFYSFKKELKDIYDYVEKGEETIYHLSIKLRNALKYIKSAKEKVEYDSKYKKSEKEKVEYDSANDKKAPIYQSAHTFEKCYNIPTRNICYRIRKKVPLRFKEAHDLTDMIDLSIDLWSNQFSMELCDPRTKNKKTDKQWIDSFEWKSFKKDIKLFIEHYFIMNINDLFDHYTNETFRTNNSIVTLSDLYDKEFQWEQYISFSFEGDESIEIMGIRPFFRAILINMIANAVEAMNFYDIFKNNKKALIRISCNQSEETTITLRSTGKAIDEERVKIYNDVIFRLAKDGKLKLSDSKLEEDIKDKIFTSKPGIGSGYALIHAAHYFARIEKTVNDLTTHRGSMEVKRTYNETVFTIKLPFGKNTTNLFKNKNDYYNKTEKTIFRWQRQESYNNDAYDEYEKYEKYKKEEFKNGFDIKYKLSKFTIKSEDLKEKPDDNTKEILIIEDSRPDRFRMRMLIENLYIRYRRFAWDAEKKLVLSVDSIKELMKITKPNILILDLAWTPNDEKLMHDMLFQTNDEIKKDLEKNNSLIHSFQLLNTIKVNSDSYKYLDIIIIMSQFVPPIADGIKIYIEETYLKEIKKNINNNFQYEILHKWRDEEKFRELLINFQRR